MRELRPTPQQASESFTAERLLSAGVIEGLVADQRLPSELFRGGADSIGFVIPPAGTRLEDRYRVLTNRGGAVVFYDSGGKIRGRAHMVSVSSEQAAAVRKRIEKAKEAFQA